MPRYHVPGQGRSASGSGVPLIDLTGDQPPSSSPTLLPPRSGPRKRRGSDSVAGQPGPPPSASQSSISNSKRFKHSEQPPREDMSAAVWKGKTPLGGDPSTHSAEPMGRTKKLFVKNRKPIKEEPVLKYFERLWKELDTALDATFADRPAHIAFDRLCRGVEDICRHGHAPTLYRTLRDKCEGYLKRTVLPAILEDAGNSDLAMLDSVLSHWKRWSTQSKLIRSTFSFLDRSYLLKEKGRGLQQINDMTISQFRRMVFAPAKDSDERTPGAKVISAMCQHVYYDRVGDCRFDSSQLIRAVNMLHIFGIYLKSFEPNFLKTSVPFFEGFAEAQSQSTLKNYVIACQRLLNREDSRCDAYHFDSTTKRQLLDAGHDILISRYADKLLDEDSLFKLISENDLGSLDGVYTLLKLSHLHKTLKEPWGKYIRRTGAAMIRDHARGEELCMRLLELRKSLDRIIRDSFQKDEDFTWALREAFTDFINDRKRVGNQEAGGAEIGEVIAKYIDTLLRGGIKALPTVLFSDNLDRADAQRSGLASAADEDTELDRQLDQALELFRFVEGKAVFEAFYKRDLARRLLLSRSASQDAERSMLTKLRGECGANFTHNLEQMFKDKALAKDEMDAYRQSCLERGVRLPLELQVMVLSAAAWPSFPDIRVTMPTDIASMLLGFDGHYKTKHSGRVLSWKHGLAHCVVAARFARGPKELLVSFFQALVLLLFNDVPADAPLAYAQISTATGLAGQELDRTLQSLACGKARVLTKYPKGRDVSPTDTFTYNQSFWDPKFKVKINQIQLRESKEENKATHERVVQDRRLETQAAVVRIMKSRKKMAHAVLVAEVIDMTKNRGVVDAPMIKKEIESLIEKEYLERDEGFYHYLA